jgi:DnaD/phage-associated family protein
LRDLAKNLSAVGGVPLDYIKQAFREAASHDKRHISYVRAILLDWLGVPRGPPSE